MTDHGSDTIAALHVDDVRFPTSRDRDGSDAMNPFPDYSAAYLTLRTSGGEEGYALVFTVGRGNDLQAGGHQGARTTGRRHLGRLRAC